MQVFALTFCSQPFCARIVTLTNHSYEIYTSFTLWPVEIRKDLRSGIRARNEGDDALSERYLARYVFLWLLSSSVSALRVVRSCSHPRPICSAYQTALTLPLSALGPDPYLKLSGIAAVLAEVSPPKRAKQALRSVWDKGDVPTSLENGGGSSNGDDGWASYTLTNEERLRRVAVACKLAELCANENEAGEEEEKWLTWAVEEVLQLAGVHTKSRDSVGVTTRADNAGTSTSTSVVLAELELPSWMRRVDLGAPLAALGTVYARKGNVE